MENQKLIQRITLDPAVMSGKPVIRGTRLTVEHILALRASSVTEEEILGEYPGLSPEDLRACYMFATRTLADTSFVPLPAGNA